MKQEIFLIHIDKIGDIIVILSKSIICAELGPCINDIIFTKRSHFCQGNNEKDNHSDNKEPVDPFEASDAGFVSMFDNIIDGRSEEKDEEKDDKHRFHNKHWSFNAIWDTSKSQKTKRRLRFYSL